MRSLMNIKEAKEFMNNRMAKDIRLLAPTPHSIKGIMIDRQNQKLIGHCLTCN